METSPPSLLIPTFPMNIDQITEIPQNRGTRDKPAAFVAGNFVKGAFR
jgi:hypothetical protein